MGNVYKNKGVPRKLDYMAIYEDFKTNGLSQCALATKHHCSRQSARFITSIGQFFETEFQNRRKDLEEYSPEDLMRRLTALGYYGILKKEVLTDITKV